MQGIYVSGKAWQIEADKSCNNDSKVLQDYKRHFEQLMIAKQLQRQL